MRVPVDESRQDDARLERHDTRIGSKRPSCLGTADKRKRAALDDRRIGARHVVTARVNVADDAHGFAIVHHRLLDLQKKRPLLEAVRVAKISLVLGGGRRLLAVANTPFLWGAAIGGCQYAASGYAIGRSQYA